MEKIPTCRSVGCKEPVTWRVVGKDNFTVAHLCEGHKVSLYDASEKPHTTTIERVEGEQNEVAKNDTTDGRFDQPESSDSTDQSLGAGSGGSDTAGVDSRERSRALTTRPAPEHPIDDTGAGAGGDSILPFRPEAHAQSYGNLGLTAREIAVLRQPPDPADVEIRPDGIVFTPWSAVARRIDDAIGVGQWTLVPEGGPQMQDGFVCWHFHLWVRGHWVATAIGEHPDPGKRKLSLANRAEAAKSDALVKCSKALGIFRELWEPGWRIEWQAEYCERVWALASEYTTAGQWLWRRKDRRPFFKERPPKDQMETEYNKRRTSDDDAKDHLDAIARGDS